MKTILNQTFWLLVAQIATRIIGFFYTIFLARNLGVSDFGLYITALSYFSLLSSVTDFGFNRYLIRELALNKMKASQLLCNIAMLRLTVSAVLFATFAQILYFVDPDKIRVSLVLLAVMTIIPLAFTQTLDAIFVSLKKLQYSAISLLALNIFTVYVGINLVKGDYGPQGAVAALILGYLFYLMIQFVFLKKEKISIFADVNFKTLKVIVIGSLIYGLLEVIGFLSFRVDVLILAYFRGNFETGIYGASFRFLEAVVFIPVAFSLALSPVLTKLHHLNTSKLKQIYFKTLKILLPLGFLAMTGYILILPIVIQLLLPKFSASIQVIQILALAIPFIFLHIPSVQVLLATEKYLKQSLILFTILMSINIILYFMFIPKYGYIGAAWISVFSEVATFLVFFTYLRKRVFLS